MVYILKSPYSSLPKIADNTIYEWHTFKGNNKRNGITQHKVTSIHYDKNNLPLQYTLEQNYPNPFNPSTTIKYALPENSKVKVDIFNVLGQRVDAVVNEINSAGHHEADWDASNLPSGINMYRLSAISLETRKEFQSVKKMVLIK